MRWLDAVRGRTKRVTNNLDALFLIPSAAITLQTAAGLTPTGQGAVCYRSATGAAFAQTQDEMTALIADDPEAPQVEVSRDDFGFTWLVVTGDPDNIADLCTDLHAVNTSLEAQGFDAGLLCSMVTFTAAGRPDHRPRLPLQERHLLRLRAHRSPPARQPHRDQRARPPRGRAADGAGPAEMARSVECSRIVSTPPLSSRD